VRVPTLRRARRDPELPGIAGPVRVGTSAASLRGRLRPGDLAVIDHLDLDRVSAESLLAAGAAAVINLAPSSSGRYPNLGPRALVEAGVPVLDRVGEDLPRAVEDGEQLRLAEDRLYRGEEEVGRGELLTAEAVDAGMARARGAMSRQVEAFLGDAGELLRHESAMLLDGVGIPELRTEVAGRPVVVVARGHRCEQDLAALKPFLRDSAPVLVGVEEGADLLLEHGLQPDVVVGDLGAVSDRALTCGAEVVAHEHRDGARVWQERLADLGVQATVFPAPGHAADLALLLADAGEAGSVVTVGLRTGLTDLLDQGRAGVASALLVRLRLGDRLVDGRTVAALHRPKPPLWPLWLLAGLLLAALVTVLVATGAEGVRPDDLSLWWESLRDALGSVA
jgi:uncharacterized membrane-anchored protein